MMIQQRANFFSTLFGFKEGTYQQTQNRLLQIATFRDAPPSSASYYREQCDLTLSNGKTISAGIFSMPSVGELRDHVIEQQSKSKHTTSNAPPAIVTVRNMSGEARSLHTDVMDPPGAPIVVQAASQFNFLEMPSPHTVPEAGISNYENDRTQGPACATACAAGTTYRNYLVPVPFQSDGERGQTRKRQLNGLQGVEDYLTRDLGLGSVPWSVKNGYIESSRKKLESLNKLLLKDEKLSEEIISRIRIGIQQDTIVTDDTPSFNTQVTQTYNSATSIGYSSLSSKLWGQISQIILDATYEATLLEGILQSREGAPPPIVLLTKVGGGVFRNKDAWIQRAMARGIERVKFYGVALDVRIVHFGTNFDEGYEELATLSCR